MRVAIVSDIHGNFTALEAVVEDLRCVSPDLVLHGGDLSDAGSSPVEVIDALRTLGWRGVVGNTDEALFRPESLVEFAKQSPNFAPLLESTEQKAQWTRAQLGEERLAWLAALPRAIELDEVALVHARPDDTWRSPGANAPDEELEQSYEALRGALIVFGHIHQPFVRRVASRVIVNSGSVGMPFDGDPRASYAVVESDRAEIRRVEYDVDCEVKRLERSGMPHSAQLARVLRTARPQM